jgi:hypothetical protein
MIGNFVQETANAPGSAATVTLAGPAAGRRGIIAAFGAGATVYLGMDDGTQWQLVEALTVAGPPQQITITTVINNSAGTTNRLNFTGSVRIYSAIPAERNVYERPDGTIQGATATGDAVFRAADAAAARTAIGAADVAGQTFTGAIATSAGDITAQAGSLRSQISGAATTGQVVLGNGTARLYYDGAKFDLNGPLDVNGAAVAPLPIAGSGVGQFVFQTFGSGAAVVLPSGGTWAYWGAGSNVSTAAWYTEYGGIAAGGTTVAAADATRGLGRLWAWRIA